MTGRFTTRLFNWLWKPGNKAFCGKSVHHTGNKTAARLDIVCFINGLPIAVLELKSPNDENADIWKSFNQLQTYKNEISDLFVFNEALVVSDVIMPVLLSDSESGTLFTMACHQGWRWQAAIGFSTANTGGGIFQPRVAAWLHPFFCAVWNRWRSNR